MLYAIIFASFIILLFCSALDLMHKCEELGYYLRFLSSTTTDDSTAMSETEEYPTPAHPVHEPPLCAEPPRAAVGPGFEDASSHKAFWMTYVADLKVWLGYYDDMMSSLEEMYDRATLDDRADISNQIEDLHHQALLVRQSRSIADINIELSEKLSSLQTF